jgi:hypothetical protein
VSHLPPPGKEEQRRHADVNQTGNLLEVADYILREDHAIFTGWGKKKKNSNLNVMLLQS